jgi:hypothetical protein
MKKQTRVLLKENYKIWCEILVSLSILYKNNYIYEAIKIKRFQCQKHVLFAKTQFQNV